VSSETGYRRNYTQSPYGGYEKSRQLYFAVAAQASGPYHPKALVLGVNVDGIYRAYPFSELQKSTTAQFEDSFGTTRINIHWNAQANSAYATTEADKLLPTTIAYWFAWYAFHPDTEIFSMLRE